MKKPALPLCFLLLCTACTTGIEEVELLNEFVIAAYSGPPPEEVTLERYREIAEAGIDVIVPGNGTMNGSQNLKAMDLAAEAGIRVIPIDTRVMPFAQTAGISIDTAIILEMVSDYRDHPAFAGYVVRDEPPAGLFPSLANITHLFREMDPAHEPLINLFPSYASPGQLGSPDYRTHVRDYIEIVRPRLFSYDNYALREPLTWYDYWFHDLELVREETRKAGIPFWVFIQSEGIGSHMRVPTRAEVLWQVNTAVAYGARGLGWFTYWTPPTDQGIPREEGAPPPLIEEHHGAMLDVNGNRTPLYDHVREANLYIKAVGRKLVGWDNEFVARFDAGELVDGGSSPVFSPTGREANLVVGTYARYDRCLVMVANSRCETATRFSLKISGDWQWVGLISSIDVSVPAGSPADGIWTQQPGGALLFECKAKN